MSTFCKVTTALLLVACLVAGCRNPYYYESNREIDERNRKSYEALDEIHAWYASNPFNLPPKGKGY